MCFGLQHQKAVTAEKLMDFLSPPLNPKLMTFRTLVRSKWDKLV